MLHPTTWHTESWRDHVHNEVLHEDLNSYVNAQIIPALPPATRTRLLTNNGIQNIPPSLLRPRGYSVAALNETVVGAGEKDLIAPVRRTIAAAVMPLRHESTARSSTFAPPTAEQLYAISQYGHVPELPYNSADFPPRVGQTDIKRGRRYEGMDPFPLTWDPTLDQTSSRQFRTRDEQQQGKWRTYLHRPLTPPRRTATGSATSRSSTEVESSSLAATGRSGALSSRQSVSTKRYHRPIKPSLPELNKATYIQYMANTQPLLSACIAGRRRCQMSQWRDELLKRKIQPHAQHVPGRAPGFARATCA